jgi:hypothetical protein
MIFGYTCPAQCFCAESPEPVKAHLVAGCMQRPQHVPCSGLYLEIVSGTIECNHDLSSANPAAGFT